MHHQRPFEWGGPEEMDAPILKALIPGELHGLSSLRLAESAPRKGPFTVPGVVLRNDDTVLQRELNDLQKWHM